MRCCDKKIECEICGRVISKLNMSKHLRAHDKGNIKQFVAIDTKCIFCGKEFSSNSGCGVHQVYCEKNPNKKVKLATKGSAWNKGLTKETDARIKKASETLNAFYVNNAGWWEGKHHTEETKQKISESRKKYLEEHPDQVPYKLNHSSKQSYPERYFQAIFIKENIDLKYHLQVGLYELDFYNETKKIDVEIDGEQHYVDPKMPEHDRLRTEYLENLGWQVFRIRWSEYKKLTEDEKYCIMNQIKELLN